MLEALRNALRLPDLRRKILYTLLILILFRLAAHVPVPGVDRAGLRQVFEANQLLGFLNMLSGGAMRDFSVVAMGVYPYITASIIMQLVTPLLPQLEELSKEGEQGQQKLNMYTYWMTIPLAALQGFAQATLLAHPIGSGAPLLANFDLIRYPLPTLAVVISLTAGTMFSMWLGELITEEGVGNGVSIIIFGGIVAGIPQNVGQLLVTSISALLVLTILMIITVAAIVYIQEGERRVPVRYGKRVRGTRVYGGQSSHIPLRINSAGMIPLIFAQSILILPGIVSQFFMTSGNNIIAGISRGVNSAFNTGGIFLLEHVLYHGGRFHILLYRCDLPAAEPAGELAATRRFHSRHSSGPAHRRLSERRLAAGHAGRRSVLGTGGHFALLCPPDNRRTDLAHHQHGPAHCGRCGGRHDQATGSTTAHAALRGLYSVAADDQSMSHVSTKKQTSMFLAERMGQGHGGLLNISG